MLCSVGSFTIPSFGMNELSGIPDPTAMEDRRRATEMQNVERPSAQVGIH
jgi:hypothetical protein